MRPHNALKKKKILKIGSLKKSSVVTHIKKYTQIENLLLFGNHSIYSALGLKLSQITL